MSQRAGTGPDERRDSPRVPMRFEVRRAGSGAAFESGEGDLSVGGFAWYGTALAPGEALEVRFALPGRPGEVRARGEVVQGAAGPGRPTTRVRFVDMPLEEERAVARYLDDLRLAPRP